LDILLFFVVSACPDLSNFSDFMDFVVSAACSTTCSSSFVLIVYFSSFFLGP
jgi:hypothetical protein